MKRVWKLTGEAAKKAACREILAAPEGFAVTLGEPSRTLEQNALLHPLIDDIAKQCKWMGESIPMLQWKTILVSGHSIATGVNAKMTIGIEGEVVNLRESTAAMSTRRFSSLVDYVLAWGSSNGVHWSNQEAA